MARFPQPNPFGFRKPPRSRRARRRLEFVALQPRDGENVYDKAWKQFLDDLAGLETPRISYQDEFRRAERLRTCNARRNRHNEKRRLRRMKQAWAILRHRQRGLLLLAGLLRTEGAWQGLGYRELALGLLGCDLRLTRKLAWECGVIEEWLDPDRNPAEIPAYREVWKPLPERSAASAWAVRNDFLDELEAAPVPAPPPTATAGSVVSATEAPHPLHEDAETTSEAPARAGCA